MKCECNLENKGSQTLVVYENWKDWQHVAAALCSPSVLACSSRLLHWLLAPPLQVQQQ